MSTASIATSSTPTPLPPSFSKLGPSISLYVPPSYSPGELIVLCTWLGASRKHIDKYIGSYRTIAPNAKILLIQSDVATITSPYATQRKAIMPAVEVVRAVLGECAHSARTAGSATDEIPKKNKGPRILLHTFSNGGPISATALLLALHTQISAPLPLVGTIMDSGPAAGYYWKSYNAMVLSLPSGLLRLAGYVFVHAIPIGLFKSVALGRYEYPEVLVRRTLLDEDFVCRAETDAKKRICYLYSKADRMTDWKDVVEHADMARERGWDVSEVVFEGTAHCNHFVKNEGVYVGEMGKMWEV